MSFGTNFKYLNSKSTLANDKNINTSISKIKGFDADMGGTELQGAFESIAKLNTIKGYPRQLFILTDGGISDTDNLLQSISLSVKHLRVNTIGIGSGASTYLIEEEAKRGKGKSLLINDDENEEMAGKIIDLLQKTLSPCLDEFTFEYEKELLDIIAPNPKEMRL